MTVERPTDENVFGSSLDWPTPTASEYGSSNNGCPGDGRTEYATKGRPSLATMAKGWPTPKAADGRAKGNGGKRNSPGLQQMVSQSDPAIWPTPTAGDAKASGNRNLPGSKAHMGTSLTDATVRSGDWTTPTSRDWKDSSGMAMTAADGRDRCDQLPRQVFSDMTQNWASPTAHDGRRPSLDIHSTQGANLSQQIAVSQTDGPPAEENPSTTGSHRASSTSRLRLSAQWVACLMGLPSEWGCVAIERCSRLWGMGSSPTSPTRSGLPSDDAKG